MWFCAMLLHAGSQIGDVRQKIHFFCMDVPHADAPFVKAYPAETTEAFLDGHVSAFDFFGKDGSVRNSVCGRGIMGLKEIPMARRKEPSIPDALLDQLLARADPKTAFDPGGLLNAMMQHGRAKSTG